MRVFAPSLPGFGGTAELPRLSKTWPGTRAGWAGSSTRSVSRDR
ncbi:hypothetical protein BTZ20_1310 [Rhodococcus sp. MTM3W5.2]|nr:hypothetical protein BTZ20_1310 [Rhodococcus sp. MTM3W5.2]